MAVLAGLLTSLGLARGAWALSACTAAQIISQDSNCPSGTGPCTITKTFDVGDGCILDFGTRAVTLTGKLLIGFGSVTFKSGSLTIPVGGRIDGVGDAAAPNDVGGKILVMTSGAVTIEGGGTTPGRIKVSANTTPGNIVIKAGGPVTIDGDLSADRLTDQAGGGIIDITSGSDIVTQSHSNISALGGVQDEGGLISFTAGGKIDLGTVIDARGGDGGEIDILAAGDAVIRDLDTSANGDAGFGGDIDILAKTVQLFRAIDASGSGSTIGSGGGDGGDVSVEAEFGDVTVTGSVASVGAGPDGSGGGVDLTARGSVRVQATGSVSAPGIGTEGGGGEIDVDAGLDYIGAGRFDVSGGDFGGDIDILTGRDATVSNRHDSSGFDPGSFGGTFLLEAGYSGPGHVSISDRVDVHGGDCNLTVGCGTGGDVDITGCNVSLSSTGLIIARAPRGGTVELTAREQLAVAGTVDATLTDPTGADGVNTFTHPSRNPASVTGVVTPAANDQSLATCTATGQTGCLVPCPVCGNGVVEYPETCDNNVGTPQSCDGCSAFCQVENCTDTNVCTTDSCDPALGCRHEPAPSGTSCDDGNLCNGIEVCSGIVCTHQAAPDCDDHNPCTTDSCLPASGCQHVITVGAPCEDGNACTDGDSCNALGTCAPGSPLVCNDNLECTTDSCNPASGCVFTPRTGTCTDDGIACTNDVCSGGLCTHPPKPDGTACADDGNACTRDVCGAGACTHPPANNGTPCDDGLFCSVSDTCQGGACTAGPARNCADTNPCTIDSCDEGARMCVHQPVTGPCCGNGAVESGEECDDGNNSNTDDCLTTCRNATCGDGFVHTGVEACDLGAANSDAPNAACRTDCQRPRCGDGILDDQRGEQCDDGNAIAGDGCSPRCYIEPPSTAELIAGKGSELTDCAIEWAYDRPTFDKRGKPAVKQACQDGDPACDFGTAAGECVFQVWLCANNHDARLPLCAPGAGGVGSVAGVTISKPSPRDASSRPVDAGNRQELLFGSSAAASSGFDTCGPRMRIRVVRKSPTAKGAKKLKLKALTSSQLTDSDSLKLFCMP